MPYPTLREQQQEQPASQSDNTPLASLQKQITQIMEMIRSMCIRLEALKARSRPTQSVTQSDILQEEEQCNTEIITETVSSSSDTTGLLSTVSYQSTQPVQEKSLQQANAENTAENTTEKPSDSKAPSTKNTAQLSKIPRHLSTIPRQIATQQAEDDTTI